MFYCGFIFVIFYAFVAAWGILYFYVDKFVTIRILRLFIVDIVINLETILFEFGTLS